MAILSIDRAQSFANRQREEGVPLRRNVAGGGNRSLSFGGVRDKPRLTREGELAFASIVVFDAGMERKARIASKVLTLW